MACLSLPKYDAVGRMEVKLEKGSWEDLRGPPEPTVTFLTPETVNQAIEKARNAPQTPRVWLFPPGSPLLTHGQPHDYAAEDQRYRQGQRREKAKQAKAARKRQARLRRQRR